METWEDSRKENIKQGRKNEKLRNKQWKWMEGPKY